MACMPMIHGCQCGLGHAGTRPLVRSTPVAPTARRRSTRAAATQGGDGPGHAASNNEEDRSSSPVGSSNSSNGGGSSSSGGSGGSSSAAERPGAASTSGHVDWGDQEPPRPWPANLPTGTDGLNWWCYSVIGLIFLTDFTPAGALLLSGGVNAGAYLAGVQWGCFVLPTLNWCRESKWDVVRVFRLHGCSAGWVAAGAASGAALWAVTAYAVSARTGVDVLQLTGAASAASAGGGAASAESAMTSLLFGGLLQQPGDAAEWARVLLLSALSPAVAEELLYRGFLLSAVREKLGRVDALAVTAAAFAAAHLSIPQFFGLTLLGGACGVLALASGSVLPAVAAHASYNATGLAVGLAVTVLGSRG